MPGQRDPNKKIIGGYVDQNLKEEISRIAEEDGKSVTDVVIEFLKQGIVTYRKSKPKKGPSNNEPTK